MSVFSRCYACAPQKQVNFINVERSDSLAAKETSVGFVTTGIMDPMKQQTKRFYFNRCLSCMLLVLLSCAAAGAGQSETAPADSRTQEGVKADDGPVVVVRQAASELQERLSGRQAFYAANTEELYALIDNVLLPNFDVEYAGKQVLGKKHWMAADEEQRERFIAAFYSFLIKTYSKGVLEFDQDKLLIMPDASYSKSGGKALVRTELVVSSGDNIQVNYAVRNVASGWKIYDVRIDGISYIQNYRNQFDAEISAQGIDAVILRLEEQAEQQANPQTT
jgi:phospholipid transport system substrate-binding protein